jgi:hypothetical protein
MQLDNSFETLTGKNRKRCLSLIATAWQSAHHFEASPSDAFAAPRLRLASGTFGFNCGIRV